MYVILTLTFALMKTRQPVRLSDARYDVIRLPGDNDDFGGFYEDAYEDAYVDIDDKPDAATDGGDGDADYNDFDLAQSDSPNRPRTWGNSTVYS